jgi:nucleoside-diphosphate-sugar epimerase
MSPKNILIVGVNGFIGYAIAHSAASAGLNIFGLSRSEEPKAVTPGEYLIADRAAPTIIQQIVAKHEIDIFVDVLAYALDETQALIDLLDSQISRYVMLSSCDVYKNYELLNCKAEGVPIKQGITEISPLRTTQFPYRRASLRDRTASDAWLDDYDKIPIEFSAQKMSCDWTILRLPMVYGPGNPQRRFAWALRHMATSDAPLVLPQAWASWTATYGYVDNVAAAIVLAAVRPEACNQVYNVGELNLVNHLKWAKRLAGIAHWDGEIRTSDNDANPMARSMKELDLTVPLKIDSRKIRAELGFPETVPLEHGLCPDH